MNIFGNTKKVLCVPCALAIEEEKNVLAKRVAGGVGNKITCERCGRRRYGGEYELVRRKK